MKLLVPALTLTLTSPALADWVGGIGWNEIQGTYTRTSEFAGEFTASGIATLGSDYGSVPLNFELNLPIELRPGYIGFGLTTSGSLVATDTDGDALIMPVSGVWESETFGALRFDGYTSTGTMVPSPNSDFAFGLSNSAQVPFSFLAYTFAARIEMFVNGQPLITDLDSSFSRPTNAYVYIVPTPTAAAILFIAGATHRRRRR